jgi:tetratricopeptide (TPR) repeat protein
VREEGEATSAFYEPYASFFDLTPADLVPFLEQIENRTGLARSRDTFPTDRDTVSRAAEAFANAAVDVYRFELSVQDNDPDQLDRFANAHLVDPILREFLDGPADLDDLSDEHAERYALALDRLRIPNEPLLCYSMGAFWGEWLVAHRNAAWRLYEPLRPLQSFPDMISAIGTVCIPPFSQVTKKLSSPAGDGLAYKVAAFDAMKRFFPPYPLIASIADANHAVASGFPAPFMEAWQLAEAGNHSGAVSAFERFLQPTTINPQYVCLAVPWAWATQQWDLVEGWSLGALEVSPRHPVLNHNLAALYSRIPDAEDDAIRMLEIAIEEEPSYWRAHLTLASCLIDAGRVAKALEHLDCVIEHDLELRDRAEELKAAISGGARVQH